MSEYQCRYYSGDTRYTRSFLTGYVKAANIVEAAEKAQAVAERKGLTVASVDVVFSS